MDEEMICHSEVIEYIKNIFLIVIVFILMNITIGNVKFYDRPKMDENSIQGVPVVEEKYEYSTLIVNEGYEIGVCGNPKIEDDKVELYITNLERNEIWIKVQILNEKNDIIGETGLIEPSKYVKEVNLKEKIDGAITIKIIEYDIGTYNSMGCVNLKIDNVGI